MGASNDEMGWNIEGDSLYIAIDGRLDTLRAMNLDERLSELSEDVSNIYFDFNGLDYIASAGLRILYWAQEYTEDHNGQMSVKNVSKDVMEIFNLTGFADMISIE